MTININNSNFSNRILHSAVASTSASTTGSTTASIEGSTTASTTASKLGYITGAVTGSTTAQSCVDAFVAKISKKEVDIEPEELNAKVVNSFLDSVQKAGISDEYRPSLEVVVGDDVYTLYPDNSTSISKLEESEKASKKDLAYYNSDDHVIRFYGDRYKDGTCTCIDETVSHELYHAKEALLRNSISQEDRDELVKDILLERIKNNESQTIIKSYDGENYKTMKSPVMSEKMAEQYSDFAEKHLFNEDTQTLENLQEYYDLKYVQKVSKNNERLKTLESELDSVLSDIDLIQDNNFFYSSQNNHNIRVWKNNTEERKELISYAIAIESRYHLFKQKEVNENLPVMENYDKDEVRKSIDSNINAVEGNAYLTTVRQRENSDSKFRFFLNSGNSQERDAFMQYFNSEEELYARKEGYEAQIEELNCENKNANLLTKLKNKKQIKNIKNKQKYEQLSYDYYQAGVSLRNNPNSLKSRLNYMYTGLRFVYKI